MSFIPGIVSNARLAADQPVAASTVLVDITGFSFVLPPTKTALIEAYLPFSVGASGGFKFQLTASQTLVDYSTLWEAVDGVTVAPGSDVALVLAASGPFANAWAVAGSHKCNLSGSLKGHATLPATVSIQFACNSAANAINILKGAWARITLIN